MIEYKCDLKNPAIWYVVREMAKLNSKESVEYTFNAIRIFLPVGASSQYAMGWYWGRLSERDGVDYLAIADCQLEREEGREDRWGNTS